MQRILNARFLLLHFDFGRRSDFDHGNTACQFCQAFLQLLAVVVTRRIFDFLTNLLDSTFNFSFFTCAINDRGVFFAA